MAALHTQWVPVSSTGQRNSGIELVGWCLVPERFARPGVYSLGYGVELLLAVRRKIVVALEVLPQQPVRILVRSPLPWAAGVAEVHGDVRLNRKALVLSQLRAAIPGQ